MSTSELRLYDFPDAFSEIADALLENGGELTPDLEARLNGLRGLLAEKADGIAGLAQQFTRQAEAAAAEAKRLTELARVRSNSADRLRGYLLATLERLECPKLDTARFALRVQANPPAARWTREPEELPEAFRRVTVAPDLRAAAEALRRGETLPEGFEVVRGSHLRIR